MIGTVLLCPCCQYRDPAGEPSASIRLTAPNKKGQRTPYMQCGACGVKFWGNRPEHLAAVVAWSSLINDSKEISEAMKQRIGSIFTELSGKSVESAPVETVETQEVSQ